MHQLSDFEDWERFREGMSFSDMFDRFFCHEDCKAHDVDIVKSCGFSDAIVVTGNPNNLNMPGLPLSARLPGSHCVPQGPRRYGDDRIMHGIDVDQSDDFVAIESCNPDFGPSSKDEDFEDRTLEAHLPSTDAVIGKGFTAVLKRGVAIANDGVSPGPAEIMHTHEDGGFIATIQQGLTGMFGVRPTSKEELLRLRGMVKASEYEAVPSDDLDHQVQHIVNALPEEVADCLKLFRKAKGEYLLELAAVKSTESVRVFRDETGMLWTQVLSATCDNDRTTVCAVPPEPFDEYVSHCAHIAYSLQNGHAVTQVPSHMRMSFEHVQSATLSSGTFQDRFVAMRLATKQASIREKAAVDWKSHR